MGTKRRNYWVMIGIVASATAIALAFPPVRRVFHPLAIRMRGTRTVEQRVAELAHARDRVRERCDRAGVAYPPAGVVLLGLKDERRLIVYAGTIDGSLKPIADFPILAASGTLGPKLREGDRQVPEGVYALESLNPNSRFHAALRVGYPNGFDRDMAAKDGRSNLGGDIMIHGGSASIGCLAMGDPAIEEIFVLAASVGIEHVKIVISPVDLRSREVAPKYTSGWRSDLHQQLKAEMVLLPP